MFDVKHGCVPYASSCICLYSSPQNNEGQCRQKKKAFLREGNHRGPSSGTNRFLTFNRTAVRNNSLQKLTISLKWYFPSAYYCGMPKSAGRSGNIPAAHCMDPESSSLLDAKSGSGSKTEITRLAINNRGFVFYLSAGILLVSFALVFIAPFIPVLQDVLVGNSSLSAGQSLFLVATRVFSGSRSSESQLQQLRNATDRALMAISDDLTFTQFEDTRIYFRPLQRKVALPSDGKDAIPALVDNAGRVAFNKTLAGSETRAQKPSSTTMANDTPSAEVNDVKKWGMAEVDQRSVTLMTDDASRRRILCVDENSLVHYHRIMFDVHGNRIESSYAQGKQVMESASNMNPCLRRVLQLMCAGDKWEIMCPPELAFGSSRFASVGPYALVGFRVDVVEVASSSRELSLAEADLAHHVHEVNGRPFTREDLLRRVVDNKPTTQLYRRIA